MRQEGNPGLTVTVLWAVLRTLGCRVGSHHLLALGTSFVTLRVAAQACNPSTREVEAGGSQVQNSLGYIGRFCLRGRGRKNLVVKKESVH